MTYISVLVLAFVGLSLADTNLYPRGCIYANGRCVQECPVGTQAYSIGCGFVTREATCANSRPKPDKHSSCGYSACHCVHPTVRDEKSGQCVHLDHCPGAKIIHGHGGGGKVLIERKPMANRTPGLPVVQQAPKWQQQQLPQLQQPQAPTTPQNWKQPQQFPQASAARQDWQQPQQLPQF